MTHIREKLNRVRIIDILKWGVPIGVLLFLLFFKLSDVAGLHRDEAAFGLFAEKIQAGLRPIRAFFNLYTSPVHSYVIAACFALFGESIWSLRVSGVFFNCLAMCCYIDLVRRLYPRIALQTFWFLATMPALVVMTRIAGENYALNAFFLFGAIWCFYVLGETRSNHCIRKLGYALSGLFCFLCFWNHAVTAPAIGSVIVVYRIVTRPPLKKILTVIPWFAGGALIGMIPRLYGILVLGHGLLGGKTVLGGESLLTALLNLIYTIGGDALYSRACGEILLSFNGCLPLCLVLSGWILFCKSVPQPYKRGWLAVASVFILTFIGSWYITPPEMTGSRIWLIPIWFIPLLLAFGIAHLPKWVAVSLGVLIVIVNLTSLSINYFYNFLEDGGIGRQAVYVGGRTDNSYDFIEMRPLIEKIASYNNAPVFIEDYTIFRLRFLLPKRERKRAHLMLDAFNKKQGVPLKSLLIFQKTETDRPAYVKTEKFIAEKRPTLSTSHFEVFEVIKTRRL